MSHSWSKSTHPYGPGMSHVRHRGVPTTTPGPDGLGLWGQLAIIGGNLAAKWVSGIGGDKMSDDVYYPDAMAGVVHCPGQYDVKQVETGIRNLPAGSGIPRQINSLFAGNEWWSKMGVPRTPRQQAGALVAWAHGGHDCKRGGSGLIADDIVQQILAVEAERRRTPAGQVSTVVEGVTRPILGDVLPGGVSPLVLAGAGAVLFFLLRR